MSDYHGAALMLDDFPPASELLADKGYDADWFREALQQRGIKPCIPPKANRKIQIPYDKAVYKCRHKIENMFGKLKDWRRIVAAIDRQSVLRTLRSGERAEDATPDAAFGPPNEPIVERPVRSIDVSTSGAVMKGMAPPDLSQNWGTGYLEVEYVSVCKLMRVQDTARIGKQMSYSRRQVGIQMHLNMLLVCLRVLSAAKN